MINEHKKCQLFQNMSDTNYQKKKKKKKKKKKEEEEEEEKGFHMPNYLLKQIEYIKILNTY